MRDFQKNLLRLITLALVIAIVSCGCAIGESEPTTDSSAAPTTEPTPEPTDPLIAEQNSVDVDDLMLNTNIDDKGWWNILLLGTDKRDEKGYGRTDTMVILSVNPSLGKAKLTSIMRDTWVHMYGVGDCKLNAASVYGGPDLTIRTINEYFGMNISQYVIANFTNLADIVDMVGGIDIDITEEEMKRINTQLGYDALEFQLNDSTPLAQFGENIHINGNQSLAYARIRNIDSDFNRTQRQRNVLIAIGRKLQDTDIKTITQVVLMLLPCVETNLSLTDMISLASSGLKVDISGIEQYRLPVDGTYDSGNYDGIWSIRPNFEKNKKLLHDFIYGAE